MRGTTDLSYLASQNGWGAPNLIRVDAPRIMVVDDDANITDVLSRYLEREGFAVETASDGRTALRRALKDPPDLMVLDVMLPGLDGFAVCRRLRAMSPVPVILLTARGAESDRVVGLEIGADDYVVKPFSPKEVTARVRAVLRRTTAPNPAATQATRVLRDGDIEVDLAKVEATRDGDVLALTAREFELLAFLMRHQGQAFRRDELLAKVWGFNYGDTSTVTVHVRRLREKVERDPSNPTRLRTVWGVGYRWDGTSEQEQAQAHRRGLEAAT
ncbi:MAG: response regulator transcription factor [Microthrixaceae bacterium]|nr:response regulator transcription factor [Microthrixaceae bacterium]